MENRSLYLQEALAAEGLRAAATLQTLGRLYNIYVEDSLTYADVHPAYLSSRFKQETGSDFSTFVSRRKIQESAYFVRHSRYSVSQIAFLYGFSSQSYYITTFKKVLGVTPMVCRSQFLSK